ncbi:replication protein P [Pantoea piersonii]|uniref:replication protein P n=1 Tax=Pantoea piersonii TaxID=2364647 RepID=UPI0022F18A13|nr:replication protein P [Pantoea piersonii]WBV23815.1 replication protein P [Pantoea piersonii]
MTNREAVFNAQQQGVVPGLAGTCAPKDNRGVNSSVEQLVDILFASLKLVFPASVCTTLKDPRDEAAAKRQWIAAFIENGITSRQQLSTGMKHARASSSPFWPTPGQFIRWCKQDDYSAAGLPEAETLYDLVMSYCARRGLYESPESYPWKGNAEYWLVTGLYSQMKVKNLSESKLRQACSAELRKMFRRIRSGERIPAPRKQLVKLHVPVSNQTALRYISSLRSQLSLRKPHSQVNKTHTGKREGQL